MVEPVQTPHLYPKRIFSGSFDRQLRQRAVPIVLLRSQRGQRGVLARPETCSLVNVIESPLSGPVIVT